MCERSSPFLRTAIALLQGILCLLLLLQGTPASGETAPAQSAGGNESCTLCHLSIYQTYVRTPMAHASGPAMDGVIAGEFNHLHSGVDYRIYSEEGRAWLSFKRPGDPLVAGKRELEYFIGSGRRGRTYVFSVEGFLFESPINWYAEKQVWDMTPAYQEARELPMTLPFHTGCLACHTSGVQAPFPGTENRYPVPPFLHAGITCERCHGPGTDHMRGDGGIVNPITLDPLRRDDICMQCHLEGDVSIEEPGRQLYQFEPGERLADYMRYFVFKNKPAAALSEVEAFTQSECRRKSGAAMSCMTCHDPHLTPERAHQANYYRDKCLSCHGNAFGLKHHPENPDCVGCHMPSVASSKIAHTQQRDHRILRRPDRSIGVREPTIPTPELVGFPDGPETEAQDARDLALAYETLAERGDRTAQMEADRLVSKALAHFPGDALLLSAAGFIAQNRGELQKAQTYYERALQVDPYAIDAAVNLGVIDAQHGKLKEAVLLWQDAFKRNPGKSEIGVDLALAFCQVGHFKEARRYTMRVLRFNPDMHIARTLLQNLQRPSPSCR